MKKGLTLRNLDNKGTIKGDETFNHSRSTNHVRLGMDSSAQLGLGGGLELLSQFQNMSNIYFKMYNKPYCTVHSKYHVKGTRLSG